MTQIAGGRGGGIMFFASLRRSAYENRCVIHPLCIVSVFDFNPQAYESRLVLLFHPTIKHSTKLDVFIRFFPIIIC